MNSSEASQKPTSTSKLRNLLQTVTHLVPGDEYGDKLDFVRNTICQHQWNRDFDFDQDRCFPYGDCFGIKNRKCFFLIDHHGHDHTVHEEEVPVLWYQWTGESLVLIDREFPRKIQKELTKWPFTWEGRKFHRVPKGPDGQYAPVDRRRFIKSHLELGVPILDGDFQFLSEYPEHSKWLKSHLLPELWMKIERFCNLPDETG